MIIYYSLFLFDSKFGRGIIENRKEVSMSLSQAEIETLASQVASEYAELKRQRVDRIDYSQLLLNTIRGAGIEDPDEIVEVRSKISKIRARRRAEMKRRFPRAWFRQSQEKG